METEQSVTNINAEGDKQWDRAWTIDEIRKNSGNWSLAGDVGLYNLLNEFSHNIISRTHEVENAVDSLVHETKMASAKINNIINDFHMLSNLQFVENRVYDEEIEEPSPEENAIVEKTKEQKEAEMLPKIIKAVELGLSVLDQAFDKINVNEISDSEDEEELSSEGRTILEPKDPYENRPLPFIIGSEEFQSNDYAGLQDLIEDDVELSDHVESSSSSMSETDETSDEEEPLPLDDEKYSVLPNKSRRAESISDSSEESELFGSEKNENGLMSDSSLESRAEEQKSAQVTDVESKSNEKVSRPNSISSLQSKLNLPQVLPVRKLQEKKKASDDLFTNEDDISDDESPFRKKTGLFASDTRFDENKDIFGDDLFDEKPKEAVKSIKSPKEIQAPKEVPSVKKSSRDDILFDNDDDSEDDIFNTLMKTKKSGASKKASAGSQDSSEKGDSSSTPSSAISVKPSSNSFGFAPAGASDLFFGDESNDDDLFSNKSNKKFDFDTVGDEDDLFGSFSTKSSKTSEVPDGDKSSKGSAKQSLLFESVKESNKASSEKPLAAALSIKAKDSLFGDSDSSDQEIKEPIIPVSFPKKKEAINLFADDDADDIFNQVKPKETLSSKSATQEATDLFNKPVEVKAKETSSSKSVLQDSEDLFSKPVKKDITSPPTTQKKVQKSLFEDSDNFDLFNKKDNKLIESFQEPQSEQNKSIFEDSDQSDMFAPSKLEKIPTPNLLTDSEDMFSGFDVPADSSKTLNVISKDRAKITAKRRKPTKKGRLAALESSDKENINTNSTLTDSEDIKSSKDDLFSDSKDKTSSSERTSPISYKIQEKKKMNLMSQLINEVATTKIGKRHSPDKVDNIVETSKRDQTEKDDFSFLSPVRDSFDSSFASKTKENESNVLNLESEDEDFFAGPSFKIKDSFDSGVPSKKKDDDEINVLNVESTDNDDFFAEPSFKR
ncbi:WASH complex subunit 2-like isoform X2 [Stegodyphus dumicola]|uniref:WASH complex subunit 2-like isoform X2 n=1 Tax=Stegodyphus dumicola TaxID=202533 RepID=UPI0015A99EC3|nr:WASH complex subunit 2-like isoform X2 [Stegodyphus dumicola]